MIDLFTGDAVTNADRGLDTESLAKEIDFVLQDLNPRDREIIRMCFGIGSNEMTLDEIGSRFNLSRERVRQLREVTLTRLRRNDRTLQLRKYLS
jgi:RNA polymerase primary sigma factor